tara:strand:+ start:2260 stop:2496 length:237 start_codon:yes stop_codon:yes gene_type:complete
MIRIEWEGELHECELTPDGFEAEPPNSGLEAVLDLKLQSLPAMRGLLDAEERERAVAEAMDAEADDVAPQEFDELMDY